MWCATQNPRVGWTYNLDKRLSSSFLMGNGEVIWHFHHFPKNKSLHTDGSHVVSVKHLFGSTGTARKAKKRNEPDCCRTAAGEEKDTADKCINYFLNIVSQLTLHATFQVSQSWEDERSWRLFISQWKTLSQKKDGRWEKMTNLRDNSSFCSSQKQRQKSDQITLSLASREFPALPVRIWNIKSKLINASVFHSYLHLHFHFYLNIGVSAVGRASLFTWPLA